MGNPNDRRRHKRAAKAQARRRRLARDEAQREQHARLVAERYGDPRFVQRRTDADGVTVSWHREAEAGREMEGVLASQMEAFRAKFGREPGPGDPLFFNPDADEPTPYTENDFNSMLTEVIEAGDLAGAELAYMKAFRDLGYMVSTESEHTFSAAEVQAWRETVERHLADNDSENVALADLSNLVRKSLLDTVQRTIQDRDAEAARSLTDAILNELEIFGEDEGDEEAGGVVVTLIFSVLAAWLVGVRDCGVHQRPARECVAWVCATLGPPIAEVASRAAGLLGADDVDELTVQELADELEDDFVPALIWLAAAAVARFGGGDVRWLHQFDVQLG